MQSRRGLIPYVLIQNLVAESSDAAKLPIDALARRTAVKRAAVPELN